jgi:lipopolysaccharide biosynthesis glycosyltransferase
MDRNKSKKLNVVFTVDSNYLAHFTTAIKSLLDNNQKIVGRCFLVIDFGENFKVKLIKRFLYMRYSINLEIIEFNPEKIIDLKISANDHVTHATYFRLLLPQLIPEDVDEILYLDSDLVVHGDISQLLELNFSSNKFLLYAVNENNFLQGRRDKRTSLLSSESRYFNAGVMYVNLQEWRSSHLSLLLLENAKIHSDKLIFWDQDVLNFTCKDSWGTLPKEFNVIYPADVSLEEAKIVHFIGPSKPWHFFNVHPYRHLYGYYRKGSPFYPFFRSGLLDYGKLKHAVGRKYIKSVI